MNTPQVFNNHSTPDAAALAASAAVAPVARLFLTPDEAAALAGCHVETVRDALRAGELHGEQRSARARWRIRPACVEAWVFNEPCQHQAAQRQVASIDQFRRARYA